MYRGYKVIRDCIKSDPLSLLNITDKNLLEYAEKIMPMSVGIEFEAKLSIENSYKEAVRIQKLCKEIIPELMEVDVDPDEQRFRLPSGIKGIVALYKLSGFMKRECQLNPASGIHYHIDCTDCKIMWLKPQSTCVENSQWMLKAIKSWNYTGNYNRLAVSTNKTAIRLHEQYKTIEFRIGEMTFDYELLIKRIIHCQNITSKVKDNILKREHSNNIFSKKIKTLSKKMKKARFKRKKIIRSKVEESFFF